MFCVNCGSQIPDGSAFCPSCGHRVGETPGAADAATAAAKTVGSAASRVVDKINELAGGTDHVDLKFTNLVDSVFKKHEKGEVDELFACGTPSTTPPLAKISSEWPHPWVYSRVLAVLLVAFAGLYYIFYFTMNSNMLPGLMFVGALVVPFAVVILFFETNAPRNIGLVRILEIFFVGGMLSLACSLFLFEVVPGTGTGALVPSMLTGLVEELGKAAVVAFFLNRTHCRNYILSGILVGAAVGAGFAVFETAGYIFNAFITAVMGIMQQAVGQGYTNINDLISIAMGQGFAQGFLNMMDTAVLRAVLAAGGHVAWAAVEGGALALCDKGEGFKTAHLSSYTFLSFLVICIVLHGIWDMYVPVLDDTSVPFFSTLKHVLLVAAIWVVLLVLLHRGLVQINELSRAAVATEDAAMGAPAECTTVADTSTSDEGGQR